ncbi:MAG: CHAT domain-containing protein [Merismopedia sp. SIO2A8]|nr:CHAT domain-containing protein [Merismopedia sp. SIO2A8]
MPFSRDLCLSLAIRRLDKSDGHYAVWVLHAPFPGGYVHRDRPWPLSLSQTWRAWQEMFASIPIDLTGVDASLPTSAIEFDGPAMSYSSRIMQQLGIELWRWLFDGSIKSSLDQSQGIALGLSKPLRVRLDIRDPHFISLPWETMQAEAGVQAMSLGQNILFSRTTTAVDPLPRLRAEQGLNVLLVLGQDGHGDHTSASLSASTRLKLEQEADAIVKALERSTDARLNQNGFTPLAACSVDTLVQPTPAELVTRLENHGYNVLFYAGHGVPAPDGGLLYLRQDATINGTELAQVLTRCQIKLAVFNACWGAQPDRDVNQQPIPRSSLAEVLIHHGLPSVLAMRDTIADQEALSFIEAFAQALVERMPIDRAVAIARQQLLTLYKFNQPAWTLPVLYMHPEFDGELIRPMGDGVTEIPENSPTWLGRKAPTAYLRLLDRPSQQWSILAGMMRVGTWDGNDLVLQGAGISRKHAEIFYRDSVVDDTSTPSYYLRDFSRYGTLVSCGKGWQRVHHREIPLTQCTQLKFGSHRCQTLEFIVDAINTDTITSNVHH